MSNILSIQNLQNVFVTNSSIISDKGEIIKSSCVSEEAYKVSQTLKFRFKYFFPLFSFKKKTYILITDEWSKNYCHWLWEALSKLIIIKEKFPEATLLLPKSYLKINFIMKSLEVFGFNQNNILTIPGKSRLRVKNLAMIFCISILTPGYYAFLKFREVSQALLSYHQKNLKTNFGERIYISRSNPKRSTIRKATNEAEVTKLLVNYNFKIVYMEDFSFLEQISISNSAKFIVAPHGAGITNVMFSEPTCHLVELVNKKWSKTCFAEMCDKVGIDYHRIDCLATQADKTVEVSDIAINVEDLEKKLIEILR